MVVGIDTCSEEHIRCLVLSETDDPSLIIAQYDVPLTKAIVVLSGCAHLNYSLETTCPVLLVCGSDADHLELAMDGCEEMMGRVDISKYAGTVPHTVVERGRASRRVTLSRRPYHAGMEQLELLFGSGIVTMVTQDNDRFGKVMQVCSLYEKSAVSEFINDGLIFKMPDCFTGQIPISQS